MAGKLIKGMSWSFVQLGVSKFFTFVIKLVLARLLFPEQFGLVGMAVVFTSILGVFNGLGVSTALVQMNQKKLTNKHYNTAFWTRIVWSILLYLIIFFGVSPFVAWFYNEPILRWIVPVLSISIIANSLNTVHHIQLTRSLDFKRLAIISIISNFLSGSIAIILALSGAGVWALVFNSVTIFLIGVPMHYYVIKWRPNLEWDKRCFNEIMGFGVYTTGTELLNTFISKVDYLLIGKILSPEAVGAYTLAFVLTDTFRAQIMNVIGRVIYPVYALNQNNILQIKKLYSEVVKYNCLIIYPFMSLLLVLGEDILFFAFGEKWGDSIIPTKILALSVMVHLIVNSNTTVLRGIGKAKMEFRIQLFKSFLIFLPAIFFGVYFFGIVGGAFGVLVNKIASVFIAIYFLQKYINLTFRDLFNMIKTPIAATTISVVIGFLFRFYEAHFIIIAVVMVTTYSITVYLNLKNELFALYRKFTKKSYKYD